MQSASNLPRKSSSTASCRLFFFTDTATTEIYTLSLHDALPIFSLVAVGGKRTSARVNIVPCSGTKKRGTRSEERFSRNAETDLVCRLLLEKKKTQLRQGNSHRRKRLKQIQEEPEGTTRGSGGSGARDDACHS